MAFLLIGLLNLFLAMVGVVMQDPVLLQGTALVNFGVGTICIALGVWELK